ncbi:MAG: 16S rRNA (uracil(1498)-N(3))-methyltransferase [Planctomycetota bacterium]|nr:MAG: 16S rRNA (uracil(1498)-N(3))-methyltransferase [Planctomycetota bacterium]
MADRYFSPQRIADDASTVELTGGDAHHLSRVMRAQVGDSIVLFDGSGTEFDCRITAIAKRSVTLAVENRRHVDREASCRVVLASAIPKGDREHFLIEKAVELGAACFIPLLTTRSVVKPKIERLERFVIEASKQCGRTRLMEIVPPMDWNTWLHSPLRPAVCLIAHPRERLELPDDIWTTPEAAARSVCDDSPQAVGVCVGPEGGFTDAEVQAAIEAGCRPVDLGRRILRIETAALALLARVIRD